MIFGPYLVPMAAHIKMANALLAAYKNKHVHRVLLVRKGQVVEIL